MPSSEDLMHRTRPTTELRTRLPSFFPELHARALRLARNDAVALDLIQDTYERALRFEYQYVPNSNLRAWLQTILLSVFVTRCRRLRREQRALASLGADPCAWTLPEARSPMQGLSPSAAKALGALPAPFREVVELVDIRDMSYRDAAEVIGVPLGTVMSRLHRGRRLLAATLRDPAGDLPEAA
jgi:RNA polymerase sigma-70 factor, ECF subfamily